MACQMLIKNKRAMLGKDDRVIACCCETRAGRAGSGVVQSAMATFGRN